MLKIVETVEIRGSVKNEQRGPRSTQVKFIISIGCDPVAAVRSRIDTTLTGLFHANVLAKTLPRQYTTSAVVKADI